MAEHHKRKKYNQPKSKNKTLTAADKENIVMLRFGSMDASGPPVRSWSDVSKATGFMIGTIHYFVKRYKVTGEISGERREYFRVKNRDGQMTSKTPKLRVIEFFTHKN